MKEVTIQYLDKYWREEDIGLNIRSIADVLKQRMSDTENIPFEDIKIVDLTRDYCPLCGAGLPNNHPLRKVKKA